MSMKNSNDTLGNRTRALPVCSAVPQPTAPPLAPHENVPSYLTANAHSFYTLQLLHHEKSLYFSHRIFPRITKARNKSITPLNNVDPTVLTIMAAPGACSWWKLSSYITFREIRVSRIKSVPCVAFRLALAVEDARFNDSSLLLA
jgi:hypothetical protein